LGPPYMNRKMTFLALAANCGGRVASGLTGSMTTRCWNASALARELSRPVNATLPKPAPARVMKSRRESLLATRGRCIVVPFFEERSSGLCADFGRERFSIPFRQPRQVKPGHAQRFDFPHPIFHSAVLVIAVDRLIGPHGEVTIPAPTRFQDAPDGP